MNSVPLTEARRILVLRSDHIGDLIVSTPFLKSLRKAAPQAEIIAVLPDYTAPVLASETFIDRILSYSGTPSKEFEEQLRDLHADIAICLSPRTQAYKLTYASKAPVRIGYFYSSRPLTAIMCKVLYLTHNIGLKVDLDPGKKGAILHEVQQLGELAKAIGIPYEDTLSLTFTPEELAKAEEMRKGWRRPVVLLQLHSNWLSLGWTVANIIRLEAGIIRTSRGGELIVCYGPAEKELADALRSSLEKNTAGMETPPDDIHFIGDLDFRSWASLFNCADFVVTPDTGAVHVAAAVKKPVVAVYEPKTAHLNTQQWAPWQVPHRIIVKDEPQITLERIFQSLSDLIDDTLAAAVTEAEEEEEESGAGTDTQE